MLFVGSEDRFGDGGWSLGFVGSRIVLGMVVGR